MANRTRHFYEFGPYRIDPEERVLFRGQEPIPLPPKAFDTLLLLVDRSERVVLKDDLMKGVWPDTFVEESNLAQNIFTLRKALGETAQGARYIVTVPGRGYRFAAKVSETFEREDALERKDAVERGDALPVQHESPSEPTIEARKPGRAREWAVLWVLLILGGGIAAYRLRRPHRMPPATAMAPAAVTPRPRRSFAVLGLKNLSGEPREGWLSTALAEMLTTELAAGEQMRAVPGEQVARARLDLGLADADGYAPETLARIRSNLGSDVVVLGSYTALGETSNRRLRVDLRLQDAVTGETMTQVATTGSEVQLFELVAQAGAHLREKLGLEAVSTAQAASVRASLPASPEAARLYAEGLEKLRVFDALAARDLLLRAIAVESSHPMPHSALAAAWSVLGYDQKAKQEAGLASKLAGSLSRQDRLFVEGQYWETSKQWDKAVDVYKTLFAFFPDNLDYGLRLAEAQDWAGKSKDIEETLRALRTLPPPLGEDPRIDWMEASVVSTSDYSKALAAADRAIKKGSALGERLLVAHARGAQCAKLLNAGRTSEAIAACQDAKQTYEAMGDRNGVGKELNDLAVVHYQHGDLSAAKRVWQEALANFREIGNDQAVVAVLMNIASMLFLEGDLAKARESYEQVLPKCRQVGDKDIEGRTLMNLGEVLTDEGNLAAAKLRFQEALAISRPTNDKSVTANALTGLGDALLREGDLAAARKAYGESLALRDEIGEKASGAETRVALAELAIVEGHAADAAKAAREAMKTFHDESQPDDELISDAVLAKALLVEGKIDDAQAIIDNASALSAKCQNRGVSLKFAIVAARVKAASGKLAQAQSNLDATLKEATETGFVTYQLEARLALGTLEMKSGDPSAGREHLRELGRSAGSRGFGAIAREALAAASAP
jgi:DNA-binding winged helix-turn-helix (wHTH) protein/tetratricopeptide (TPR) repeat protein/TolB-like protein